MKNNMEQIERIKLMEQHFDQATSAAASLATALDQYEEAQDAVRALSDYYGSATWKQDFVDDEQHQLDASTTDTADSGYGKLKRGVLSEDGIWNLLETLSELKSRMKALLVVLWLACLPALAGNLPTDTSWLGQPVTWDGHSLMVGGRRVCPVMGEIHFSRLPAAEWNQAVGRMKAGGVTMIATYVFWNHVEEQEGIFRWDGRRSLRRFLEVCKEQHMPVVLRLGPFCHGEARNGGIPDWMFTKGCRLRDTNPTFLHSVEALYRQIFTQVQGLQWKDGGPVVAAQFDNEYRGRGEYLMALKRIALDAGFDLPFYTRTGWPELSTPVPFGEMLPLYGDYADGFWDKDTGEGVGNYYKAFNFKAENRPSTGMGEAPPTAPEGASCAFAPPTAPEGASCALLSGVQGVVPPSGGERGASGTYPYFTCELGGGMATAYHRRPFITPDDTYALAIVKLGSGSNLLGYYMYHGGTNPEGTLTTLNETQLTPGTANNDLPQLTYDFQAPLGEFGQAYPHYYRLRPLHLLLQDWGEELATMEATFPAPQDLARGQDSTLRWAVRQSQGANGGKASGFIFVSNYERLQQLSEKRGVVLSAAGVTLPRLNIPSGCMAILPVGIDHLAYATAQPVARRGGKLYLMQVPGLPTTIALDNGKTLRNVKPRGTAKPVYDNIYLLTQDEAEHLFLDEKAMTDEAVAVDCHRVKEAGKLRTIAKGKAKVAAAPTDDEWQQAAVYRVTVPRQAVTAQHRLLSIDYRGDCARLYHNGRLVADNFQYGRPFLYGLWRLADSLNAGKAATEANDVVELELRILPWQQGAPIYLPRQADATPGEQVKHIEITTKGLTQ